MGKYYIKICECGRIYFLDNKKIVDINDDEKCEELSNLMCKIHWAGTKFEKDYNK